MIDRFDGDQYLLVGAERTGVLGDQLVTKDVTPDAMPFAGYRIVALGTRDGSGGARRLLDYQLAVTVVVDAGHR